MTTFPARPVTGCDGYGFVVEEEPCEALRQPLLVPSVVESQRTDDPKIAGMKPHDLMTLVQSSPIAGERSAQRKRLDITERRNAVSLAHALMFARADTAPRSVRGPAVLRMFGAAQKQTCGSRRWS